MTLIEAIDKEIETLERALQEEAWKDARVRLLMTIPGVDYCTALTLIAALGDLSRFEDGDHAASYLGLTPSIKQSANTCHYGSITKRGNSHARWMLTQTAQNMASHPGPLGVFFRRLAKRKCWNIAVCATARKLVVIAWLMLREQRAVPLCSSDHHSAETLATACGRYRQHAQAGTQGATPGCQERPEPTDSPCALTWPGL